MKRTTRAGAVASAIATVTVLAACNPSLPEAESAGAQLYVERCSSCHRLHAPGVITSASWDVILERMQREMRMRGVEPLSADETRILREYLDKHALRAQDASGGSNDGG